MTPRSFRVLAVALNPAVDVTYRVDRLVIGGEQRVRSMQTAAGGKAVNVARVLTALGTPTAVTGLAGGDGGTILRHGLAASGITDRLVTIAGATRRTVTVVDDEGDATGLWEPGPEVSASEWAELRACVETLLVDVDVVVLSGSLPPGIPDNAYGLLTTVAHRAGARVVVDADGSALRESLAAAPDILKPNRTELAAVDPGGGPADAGRARDVAGAHRLRAAGARAVVVSGGADGMVAVTADGTWAARPDRPVTGNPTGAGDAAVAALVRGLLDGAGWSTILADAVALGAAAVTCPTAGAVSIPYYEKARRLVKVESLDGNLHAITRPVGGNGAG